MKSNYKIDWHKAKKRLIDVPNPDPENPHRARLLNMLLVGFGGLTMIAMILVFSVQMAGGYLFQDALRAYIPGTVFIMCTGFFYYLNNHQRSQLAAWLFLIFMMIIFFLSDSPMESVWGRNMIFLAVPVLMASVILPPATSFLMAGLVAVCFVNLSYFADIPLNVIGISSYFAFAFISWIASTVLEKTAANFQAASLEAERLNQVKSDFLANMSHEIRTPLNGILGMTQVMMNSDITEEQKDFLETISQSGDTLLSIINQILDFSKIDSGKLDLEEIEFDIWQLVQNTFKILSVKAEEKGVRFNFYIEDDVPQLFVGDPMRLRQILINLLGNAIKFTDSGEICLHVKLLGRNDNSGTIRFAVQDQGIGIEQAKIENLFLPFSQVDSSTTRNFGGTGLGLSICRQIAEAMAGKIWVESQLGVGSTFFFTVKMPIVDNWSHEKKVGVVEDISIKADIDHASKLNKTSMAPFDALSTAIQTAPLRILLADDNIINQKVAYRMLERLGYTAAVVENGIKVLNELELNEYDVILMDIQMPEMDGIEATREIIKKYGERRPRIIALTANAMSGDREYFLSQGLDDYISKPVTVEKLSSALEQCASLPI